MNVSTRVRGGSGLLKLCTTENWVSGHIEMAVYYASHQSKAFMLLLLNIGNFALALMERRNEDEKLRIATEFEQKSITK